MKKLLKILLGIILVVIVAAALFLVFLTLDEYRPADTEEIEVRGASSNNKVTAGETMSIITWNVGYAGLGKDSDFVMDGGGNAPSPDREKVNSYMQGIKAAIDAEDADIYLLQEVDVNSSRSFSTDERDVFSVGNDAFALNYSCSFVPFPWPPMGKVNSGVYTTTTLDIDSAKRIALPCPFSWPLRTANLKRCMMPVYLPIEGSDKQLVALNLHLEAYDSGEGKQAQTKVLLDFVQSEYEKGNYVIAGGDWNQTFPGTLEVYPNTHRDLWEAGCIDTNLIYEDWIVTYDATYPTCRLLNQPYDPADTVNTQFYVIDGFMCSPNIQIGPTETLQKNFENSDHNPVKLTFTLLPEN